MRVFAFCAASFAEATRQAAGVDPVTCPPESSAGFDPARLVGWDLLYFDLHGQPGQSAWLGDGELTALTAEQLRSADLTGAVVFATNCHLGETDSPMLQALLAAGARGVVAGPGPNLAGARTVFGAHALGRAFRRGLGFGLKPGQALAVARAALTLDGALGHAAHRRAASDALDFRLFERSKS